MTMNLFHSLWTIVVLITFLCILFWCYSKNRKFDFETAANLALEDHLPIATNGNDLTHDEKKQEQSNV